MASSYMGVQSHGFGGTQVHVIAYGLLDPSRCIDGNHGNHGKALLACHGYRVKFAHSSLSELTDGNPQWQLFLG